MIYRILSTSTTFKHSQHKTLPIFRYLTDFFFLETLTHQFKRERETKTNKLMKKFLFLVKKGVSDLAQFPIPQ